ncbi:MAG: hypothetical protein ACTSRA_22115 [Promethearchaeota archaeon]
MKGKKGSRGQGIKNIRSTDFIKTGIEIVIVIENNTLKLLGRLFKSVSV